MSTSAERGECQRANKVTSSSVSVSVLCTSATTLLHCTVHIHKRAQPPCSVTSADQRGGRGGDVGVRANMLGAKKKKKKHTHIATTVQTALKSVGL